jgi:phage tail-like protein
MAIRDTPYGAYNFIVDLNDGTDTTQTIGGFSDVSGLSTEITMMDYRVGNAKENHVIKVAGMNKQGDVTFKRGMVGAKNFWDWIKATRSSPNERRTLTITLLDEQRNPVMSWQLKGAQPSKYSPPVLAAKGGSDVAMEELVVVSEGFELV